MTQHKYSDTWFELILKSVNPYQTKKESKFLQRVFRLNKLPKILDVACGNGRLSCELIEAGYELTGIDIDEVMIARANKKCSRGNFFVHDMLELDKLKEQGPYDGICIMWQSFGHFNSEQNTQILTQIYDLLKTDGRLVLDIYNRGFFEKNIGVREYRRQGHKMKETKFLKDDRLTVVLEYGQGFEPDEFEWQVFHEKEILEKLIELGFKRVYSCQDFNERNAPSNDAARMQIVVQKL